MGVSKKNDRLVNKFQEVEMLLDDSHINYSISADQIKSIKTIRKKEAPAVFFYSRLALRFFKLAWQGIVGSATFFAIKIRVPILDECKKAVFYSAEKLGKFRHEREIKAEEFLTKLEAELQSKKEEKLKQVNQVDSEYGKYQQEFAEVFSSIETRTQLVCDKHEFNKVKASLEYDLSLYELLSQKMIQNKMITNVSKINVNVRINQKKVVHTLEFELKIFGEKWAAFFSKHLSLLVFNSIKSYMGTVKNTHWHSLDPAKDKFIFIFTHDRLDSYVDQEINDELPPLPVEKTHRQLDA